MGKNSRWDQNAAPWQPAASSDPMFAWRPREQHAASHDGLCIEKLVAEFAAAVTTEVKRLKQHLCASDQMNRELQAECREIAQKAAADRKELQEQVRVILIENGELKRSAEQAKADLEAKCDELLDVLSERPRVAATMPDLPSQNDSGRASVDQGSRRSSSLSTHILSNRAPESSDDSEANDEFPLDADAEFPLFVSSSPPNHLPTTPFDMCYVATPDEVIYQHQPLNSLASPPRQAAPDPQLCGGGIQHGSQPGAAQSAARGSSLVAPQQSVAQGPYCGVGVGAAAATAAAAVPYYGPPPAWPPPQSGPPPVPAPEEPAGAAGAGEPGPRRLPPAGTPPRFPPADAPPCPSREAWTAPGLGQGWAESDAPGPELPPAGAAAAAASAAPGGAQRPLAASEGGAAGPPGPRREAQAPILRPAPGLRRGWAESSPERPPAGAAAAGAAGAPEARAVRALGLQQELSRSGGGVHRLWWTVHAKTLSSTDKDVVSQPFELDVAGPVHFKLGLFPRSTCDARLNASFRRAKGRGRVTLMCTDPVRARTRVQFRIAVGSASSESQEPRGPVTHDFFENRVAGLPTGSDEWDFKKIADASTETFTVLLEVWPASD